MTNIHRSNDLSMTRMRLLYNYNMTVFWLLFDYESVEFGLCNLSLEFSLTHVVVAESSFGWPWWSIVAMVVLWGWLVTMTWGGRYIKFIVWLNPTRLDSSVVRASGICPEGLGSIPSLVAFLYSNRKDYDEMTMWLPDDYVVHFVGIRRWDHMTWHD